MDEVLLTVEEAARILRVGRSTIYREMRSRRLRSIQLRHRRLVPVSAVSEYIALLLEEQAA